MYWGNKSAHGPESVAELPDDYFCSVCPTKHDFSIQPWCNKKNIPTIRFSEVFLPQNDFY